MIIIPKITDSLKQEYKEDTFKRVKTFLSSVVLDTHYGKIITYLSTNGILDDTKIENLLLGEIECLRSAIQEIGQITDDNVKNAFGQLYDNFTKRKFGKSWAERIGVKICPYCNRNYIFTLRDSGVRPQYDHFFPKSLYPYLALSMYNLIPCCAICNIAKHDLDTYDSSISEENFIYPYRDSYGERFNFKITNGDNINSWLGIAEEYSLTIVADSSASLQLKQKQLITAEKLNLIALYNKHGDFVRDIVRTSYVYDDEYFQSLVQSYPKLFSSISEAKNFVYFNYLEEVDWDKRVLSKLSHDIIEECKIE